MDSGLDLHPSHFISHHRATKSPFCWCNSSSDRSVVERMKAVLVLSRYCDEKHCGGWRMLICKELFQESFRLGWDIPLFQPLQQRVSFSLHFLVCLALISLCFPFLLALLNYYLSIRHFTAKTVKM